MPTQAPGQMPGQVAGASGSPAQKTDVAGLTGGGAPAPLPASPAQDGAKALGGGGGDVSGVLQQLIKAIEALKGSIPSSGVAGATGGGAPGQLPTQVTTPPPVKTDVAGATGAPGKTDVAGATGSPVQQVPQQSTTQGGGAPAPTAPAPAPTSNVAGATGGGAAAPTAPAPGAAPTAPAPGAAPGAVAGATGGGAAAPTDAAAGAKTAQGGGPAQGDIAAVLKSLVEVLNQLVAALAKTGVGGAAGGGGPTQTPGQKDPGQLPGQVGGGGPAGAPPTPSGPPGLTGANPGGGTQHAHAGHPH